MHIPNEFEACFNEQYPAVEIKYSLPKSVDAFPTIKESLTAYIEKNYSLGLEIVMGDIKYDVINMTYENISDPSGTKYEMSQNGFNVVTSKLYLTLDTNKSEKAFIYMLEDIKDMKPVMFKAELIAQIGNYTMLKAINIIGAWLKYCQDNSTFKMDYEKYNKIVADSRNDSN